jgi:hypothetical protein
MMMASSAKNSSKCSIILILLGVYEFALNLGDFSTLGLNFLNALVLDVFV